MKRLAGSNVVSVGKHVEIQLVHANGVDELAFDIVTDDQADFARGYLGEGTPLAQAILGHSAGSTLPYNAGDTTEVRIIQVGPAASPPPGDVQARRDAVIRRAIDQSDRTNAMIFASSFSGKWGDYDPTAFGEDATEPTEEDDQLE